MVQKPLDAFRYMGFALSSDCSLVGIARLLLDFDDNIHLIEDRESLPIWQMDIISLKVRLLVP
jgi:hypothetical protein